MKKILSLIIPLILLLSFFPLSLFAAETIRYHGSSTVVAVIVKASLPFKKQNNVTFDIKSKGSSLGIEKLLAGECDIAGVGRPLTDELRSQGVVATKLFSDAYAVIANEHVPIDSLQPEQLEGILTGKYGSWSDLAPGKEYIIKLIAPPSSSAHYKNFQQRFNFVQLPSGTVIADKAPYVADLVKGHPRAIGWLSYSTVFLHRKNIKVINIQSGEKVIPLNKSTILSGEYPYISEQYLYTMGEPVGNIKKFIEFIKSAKGNEIITSSGFFTSGL
ncbi:MAG: substrate-binding domain-containing protein [Desulfobulbaceae bacterium]|nr:substrate-binding domain-containing protein [Desulfobulbaceae bacterium]